MRNAIAGIVCLVAVASVAATGHAGSSESVRADHESAKEGGCTPNHGVQPIEGVFFAGTPIENGGRLQRGRREGMWFSKVGLLLLGDTEVTLEVADSTPAKLTGWAKGPSAKSIVVGPETLSDSAPVPGDCQGEEWRFFAGGFVFRGKHCLRLSVSITGEQAIQRFGLGKRCPK